MEKSSLLTKHLIIHAKFFIVFVSYAVICLDIIPFISTLFFRKARLRVTNKLASEVTFAPSRI